MMAGASSCLNGVSGDRSERGSRILQRGAYQGVGRAPPAIGPTTIPVCQSTGRAAARVALVMPLLSRLSVPIDALAQHITLSLQLVFEEVVEALRSDRLLDLIADRRTTDLGIQRLDVPPDRLDLGRDLGERAAAVARLDSFEGSQSSSMARLG
jgi:hypothetical protein